MLRRADTLAILGALALHAGIAAAMIAVPQHPTKKETVVDVDLIKAPPPETPPAPPEPPPPEPEKKIQPKIKAAPPPVEIPKTNQEPPKEPPKQVLPVFGMKETEMSNDGDVSVPIGNTTMIDPKKSGKGAVAPLPAAQAGVQPKAEYQPIPDISLKKAPDIDGEACARMVQYPSEAEQLGIEGEVRLRVALDDKGKVHDIKVLSGLGHGLDQAAMNALKYKCKFTPAIGNDGKPAAYVIQNYVWTFELPR